MAVYVEVRQLGNGVDNVVNGTLEAGEHFTSQWREGKTVHCSFTGIKRKSWADCFISNTFTNRNYASLEETPLICSALEEPSQ